MDIIIVAPTVEVTVGKSKLSAIEAEQDGPTLIVVWLGGVKLKEPG